MQRLEYTDFEPHIGTTFTATGDNASMELTLKQVDKSGKERDGFQPFSLLFEGPGDKMLVQQTARLIHDELEDLNVFIVPIANEDDKTTYEVLFN